jgi:hypothetical protein
MLRSDVVLTICHDNKSAEAALVWSCKAVGGGSANYRLLSATVVFGKKAEMRVMRVGRTFDRAVWLAKRGGECQKLDPETMAGIQPKSLRCCVL